MFASWLQSSCLTASTFSVQPHHLPQTQALRSCHPWIIGTPLGAEALPHPGLKCWSSVVVMALRTSDSAAAVAAAARLWAETTAQTTCSCGGCEPTLCSPGLTCPPALSLPVSSQATCRLEQSVQAGACHMDSVSSLWKHPGRTPPARPRPLLPTDYPSAPLWEQGGDVGAAQDLCP